MLRLETICSIFPPSNLLIDIGSDHGYLGIELLKKNKVSFVWNVDISKLALENGRKNYLREKLLEKASFLLSDGFKNLGILPDDSTVVCSGLGSAQILKILELLPQNIKNLVFCSHTHYFSIRDWARRNNWEINCEKYLEERGEVYIVMRLSKIDFSYFLNKKIEDISDYDLIFGDFRFWKSNFLLFKKYWIYDAKRILNIPVQYRSEIELKTLDFLRKSTILKD